jgi:hypothetical protein
MKTPPCCAFHVAGGLRLTLSYACSVCKAKAVGAGQVIVFQGCSIEEAKALLQTIEPSAANLPTAWRRIDGKAGVKYVCEECSLHG